MLLLFALFLLAPSNAGLPKEHFTDARTGVSFSYPRGYTLKRGPLGPRDTGLGYLGPIPMEFVAPGGVRIATVEAPSHSYPGTDFVNAFFTVSLNRFLTRRKCRQFPGSKDKSPTFLLKTTRGLILHGAMQSDGGAGHQFVSEYFHAYSNGECIELGYGVATAGLGAVDGMRPAPYRSIQSRFRAMLLSAAIAKPKDLRRSAPRRQAADDIIRAKGKMRKRIMAMRPIRLAAAVLIVPMWAFAGFAQGPNSWQQPAAALALKVANLLGPGRAHLSVENHSSIAAADLPAIQKLLSDDLRANGVTAGGADSANAVRVTLSESASERLWVAEVMEGDDTRVAMVEAGAVTEPPPQMTGPLVLRRTPVFTSRSPVLALLETPNGLVVLRPDEIAIYTHANGAWRKLQDFPAAQAEPGRDPRGILRMPESGQGFEAWLPGEHCTGAISDGPAAGAWKVDCNKSDDPWLLSPGNGSQNAAEPRAVAPALPAVLPHAQANTLAAVVPAAPALRAFYNAARNYFTGVIVPSPGTDIPPFYSAAFVPQPSGGEALLIGGIDGKLELLQNGALSQVDGARDWGSDFAALHSSCGSQFGTKIVASGSGQATSDSLRAFDLTGLEAAPASEPLAMNGTVTALSSAPDGKSAMAVVRNPQNRYEVDRVSASCN